MKITALQFEQLKKMIKSVEIQIDVVNHIKAYKENNSTQKRFFWDMLWAVNFEERDIWFKVIYLNCNDDHIYTALKKCMRELKIIY